MAQVIICAGISFIPYMRPVGAYQIANVLRDQGYTVQVIDSYPFLASNGIESVKKVLSHFVDKDTLWIGFSSNWLMKFRTGVPPQDIYKNVDSILTHTYIFNDAELLDLKETIYKKSPNCKFVLGGARAAIGRVGARPNFIDCFIEGFADSTVVEYTKHCAGKNPFLQYQRNPDNSISITHDHKAATFNYVNHKFKWHKNDLVRDGEALPMEIARGCIFNCPFCAYPLNGKRKLDYIKDPAIIKEQLEENFSKYNTTHYWFLDDTFNDSPRKLEILYEEVFSKLSFKINFNAFMRLDLLNAHPHTIDLLKESGCGGMSFGIETLNYEANKSIGKGITRDNIYKTLDTIRTKMPDAFVDSQFIVGLPNETKETISDWITEITEPDYPLDNVKVHQLSFNSYGVYNNIWVSNFEKYPERYGYTFPRKDSNMWVNNTGFGAQAARFILKEFENRLVSKAGEGWLGYAGWRNLGLSHEDSATRIKTQRNSRVEDDIEKRGAFTRAYVQALLKLDPNESN